jgi:type I restriction enzyme R subunit
MLEPTFRSYDVDDEIWYVPKYTRNLPHLRIEGATYFVTFRMADSLPKETLEYWFKQRQNWFEKYGIDTALEEKDSQLWSELYLAIPFKERVDFERRQQRQFFIELDKCHGSCVLEEVCAHKVVGEALEFFHGQRIWVGDYVVMPNHVHVLVQPFSGVKLEEWLYSVKRFTSNQFRKLGLSFGSLRNGHFWQTESFDRIVRSRWELLRIRKYIMNNPVRLRPGTYLYKRMDWLDKYASL